MQEGERSIPSRELGRPGEGGEPLLRGSTPLQLRYRSGSVLVSACVFDCVCASVCVHVCVFVHTCEYARVAHTKQGRH